MHTATPQGTSRLSPERLWIVQQMVYGEFLRFVEHVMGQAGITYMPIKGAYLIAAGLAEKIPRRRMLDIDILVRPDHFQTATDYIVRMLHVHERPGRWPFEREFYCEFAGRSLELEIHCALNYEERFRLPADDLFERGTPAGPVRVMPSAEDALLIAVAHALVHIVEGVDESRFQEYRLMASQPQFLWETFWQRAHASGISAFAELILRWAWQETGGTLPGAPRTWRGSFLSTRMSPRTCNTLPPVIRRALCELPFVRSPLGLTFRGLSARVIPRRAPVQPPQA